MPPDKVESAVGMTARHHEGGDVRQSLLHRADARRSLAGDPASSRSGCSAAKANSQALSVTIYAWFPRLIRGILGVDRHADRRARSRSFDLQNPVALEPRLSVRSEDPADRCPRIGSAIDIFTIWTLVLLIIGFAAMSQLLEGARRP